MFNLLEQIYSLKLELSSVCNSECIMCPRVIEKDEFKRGNNMSFDLFKKIIDELVDESKKIGALKRKSIIAKMKKKIPPEIRKELSRYFTDKLFNELEKGKTIIKLYGYGESFLNPNLFKMLSYLKNKNFCVRIATNGSKLDRDTTKRLLKLEIINDIMFSLDSHIKEIYESVRKGLDYDSIFRNINFFMNEVKGGNYKKPGMGVIITENKENEKSIKETTDFFRSKGINPLIEHDIFSRNKLNVHQIMCCPLLQHTLSIFSTGEVVKCGMDAIGMSKIGDLTKQSLKEIWLSDKNLRYLALNQSGNINKIDICRKFCVK